MRGPVVRLLNLVTAAVVCVCVVVGSGSMRAGDFSDLDYECKVQAQRMRAGAAGKQLLDRFSRSILTSGALRCKTVVGFYAVACAWFQVRKARAAAVIADRGIAFGQMVKLSFHVLTHLLKLAS